MKPGDWYMLHFEPNEAAIGVWLVILGGAIALVLALAYCYGGC